MRKQKTKNTQNVKEVKTKPSELSVYVEFYLDGKRNRKVPERFHGARFVLQKLDKGEWKKVKEYKFHEFKNNEIVINRLETDVSYRMIQNILHNHAVSAPEEGYYITDGHYLCTKAVLGESIANDIVSPIFRLQYGRDRGIRFENYFSSVAQSISADEPATKVEEEKNDTEDEISTDIVEVCEDTVKAGEEVAEEIAEEAIVEEETGEVPAEVPVEADVVMEKTAPVRKRSKSSTRSSRMTTNVNRHNRPRRPRRRHRKLSLLALIKRII